MHRSLAATLVATISFVGPQLEAAEEDVLTLDRALALARERAPALRSARLRIDEARGRRAGAAVLLRDNPVVATAAGPRHGATGTSVDLEIGVEQTFELGGRRGGRIASADAGIDRAVADADDTTRRLLRDVAAAFYRALHAEERLRLATAAEGVAVDVVRIAERRRQAGDVPVLDVNVSRAALARARSDVRAAEAARSAELGELRALLGLEAEAPISVRGDLHQARGLELDKLLPTLAERPDVRALEAEAREADADRRLAAALAWPEVGLGVRYAREEDADIVLGTLSLTLPLFERGQGLRAEATARSRRAGFDLDARRRAIAVEVRTGFDVYQRRWAAALELEQQALPLLDENEALARRSYETGQLGLAELLLIRRETLETRNQYLDRLLEAALAGVDLESSAGALR